MAPLVDGNASQKWCSINKNEIPCSLPVASTLLLA